MEVIQGGGETTPEPPPLLKPGERPSCKTCGLDLVNRAALIVLDDPGVPDGIYCGHECAGETP